MVREQRLPDAPADKHDIMNKTKITSEAGGSDG